MARLLRDSLYGLLIVACVVATLLAAVAFVAPTVLPAPFAAAAAGSNLWIVATAALTILGVMFLLLVMRALI
ncbi:hypothetical protein KY092_18305 [Natronomonas gomsonensis]|jgi:hypothetical protein|uniref:hypothetical protein n=1 Tax=Natronomonas TaxID=63743 RepID=UPI0012EA4634|nr:MULTISPECIES: hypothetical protein [Natronomonas]MCY4732496.1 hypothetical protein [Natronomonas gomsonensis]MUV87200.1 hypothetical protein [Natronomonas sp. CBA1123]